MLCVCIQPVLYRRSCRYHGTLAIRPSHYSRPTVEAFVRNRMDHDNLRLVPDDDIDTKTELSLLSGTNAHDAYRLSVLGDGQNDNTMDDSAASTASFKVQ